MILVFDDALLDLSYGGISSVDGEKYLRIDQDQMV